MNTLRLILISVFFLLFQNLEGQINEQSPYEKDAMTSSAYYDEDGKLIKPGLFFGKYKKLFIENESSKKGFKKFNQNQVLGWSFFSAGLSMAMSSNDISYENPEKKFGLLGGGILLGFVSHNFLKRSFSHLSNSFHIRHLDILQKKGYSEAVLENFKKEAITQYGRGGFVKDGVRYPSKLLLVELEDFQFSKDQYSIYKKKTRLAKAGRYVGLGLMVSSFLVKKPKQKLGILALACIPSLGSARLHSKANKQLSNAVWAHNNDLLLPKD